MRWKIEQVFRWQATALSFLWQFSQTTFFLFFQYNLHLQLSIARVSFHNSLPNKASWMVACRTGDLFSQFAGCAQRNSQREGEGERKVKNKLPVTTLLFMQLQPFAFFFYCYALKENNTYNTITNCTPITLLTITNCTLITLLTITKWTLIEGLGGKRAQLFLARMKIVKTTPNFACEFVYVC